MLNHGDNGLFEKGMKPRATIPSLLNSKYLRIIQSCSQNGVNNLTDNKN